MNDRYPPWWRPLRRYLWTRRRIMAMLHAQLTEAAERTSRPLDDEEFERAMDRLMRNPEYRRIYERAVAARRRYGEQLDAD